MHDNPDYTVSEYNYTRVHIYEQRYVHTYTDMYICKLTK